MDDLVTIATFNTPEEAYIVKGMLANNGIPSAIVDENNIYVPVFNGIRLQVMSRDADRAIALMQQQGDVQE